MGILLLRLELDLGKFAVAVEGAEAWMLSEVVSLEEGHDLLEVHY